MLETPVFREHQLRDWRRTRFVDGGYFDNSGAAAASFALQSLFTVAQRREVSDRLRVIVVEIHTRTEKGGEGPATDAAAFSEVRTPARAVLAARRTSGLLPLVSFCRLIIDRESVQQCDELADRRPGAARTVTTFRDGALTWVSARLITPVNWRDQDFVLLGWLLREQSHDRIANCARHTAPEIYAAAVNPEARTDESNDAPEGCRIN